MARSMKQHLVAEVLLDIGARPNVYGEFLLGVAQVSEAGMRRCLHLGSVALITIHQALDGGVDVISGCVCASYLRVMENFGCGETETLARGAARLQGDVADEERARLIAVELQ